MSCTFLLTAILLCSSTGLQNTAPEQPALAVEGSVELKELRALRTAEDCAQDLLWERYSPHWTEAAGRLVPSARLQGEMKSWLSKRMDHLGIVKKRPLEVFESTVGRAFRQTLDVQVQGPEADRFRAAGERKARGISKLFLRRYLGIGALWFALLLIGLRLDRSTRGYLTKRIGLAALVIAAGGAFAMYPHAGIAF